MILYSNIFNAVALRAGAFIDGTPVEIQSRYADDDLTAKIDSTETPYSAIRQDILAAEKEIAEIYSFSNNSLYKAAVGTGQSDPLSSGVSAGAAIPAVDSGDKEFIGAITGVFDADTGRALTEKTKTEIYRYLMEDAEQSFFTVPAYHFAMDGNRLITTVPSAYITGIIWDAEARETAFDTLGGESVLPTASENFWIVKTLSRMAQAGWLVQEASYYAGEAARAEQQILQGKLAQITLPQIGVKQASANIAD